MFYNDFYKSCTAAIVLTPVESKKLIARGIADCRAVKEALTEGIVVISGGTTNGYIARELTGLDIDVHRYTAGRIFQGKLDSTPEAERLKYIILQNGKPADISMSDALSKFTARDVFLKGANAVDAQGRVGVLAANPTGGTVGAFWAIAASRGAQLICPVGLEKMVASVENAVYASGQGYFDYSMGHKVGLLQLAGAKAFTEIQALEVLYGVKAVHIASGGIIGSEGAVVLSVEGDKVVVERMWGEIAKLKTVN